MRRYLILLRTTFCLSISTFWFTPQRVCKQTSYEGDLCEDDNCCQCNQYPVWTLSWCYQGLAEPSSRSTCWRWSSVQHPGQSRPVTLFDIDDGGCFGCCCSSYAFFFSFTIFWAVDLLTPVSAAVLSHTRFSDSFIPDLLSSMQNLYTFSIIAPASSLYLHTSLAILLSEVALHVHNKHVFFCKHVNRERKKIKNKKVLLGLEPSTLGSAIQFCFQILCV